MSNFLPSEVTYEPTSQPEPVVLNRTTNVVQSPTSPHTAADSPVIRFTLTNQQMVDLASIKMYADITATVTPANGSTTSLTGTTYTTKLLSESTFGLFQTLEIATLGGIVIESVQDAGLLARIMKISQFSRSWCAGAGTFFNAAYNPYDRYIYTGATTYEIGALKLLGLLKSGKYLIPADMGGGLVFTLTLAPAFRSFVGQSAGDSFTLSLARCRIVYDSLQMTPAYIAWYSAQYKSKGWQLVFDAHGGTSNVITSSDNAQVQIALQARRAKCLVSVMRPVAALTAPNMDSYALKSANMGPYQFDVEGIKYPAVAIDSHARGADQLQVVCGSSGDPQRDSVSFLQFTSDFALATNDATKSNLENGCFIMSVDLSKFSSTDESGVTIPPSGCSLYFSTLPGQAITANHVLSTYCVRSTAVTVINGNVTVDY